jgi:predicted ATP-grasp superfamily ATP-dependent carboligase
MNMPPKVIVIGIGFTSRLGMIRAVAETGAEIDVIVVGHGRFKPVDCYSKYIHRYYYVKGNDKDRVLQILQEQCAEPNRKGILIPINDFAATVVDQNVDTLKEHFLFPHIHGRQGAVTEWMNKEKQKEVAKKVGLSVANSVNVELKDGHYRLPEGINYPCFTKTRAYTKGYKFTLNRCDDEAALRKVLDRLAGWHRPLTIMLEDYKEIETEYAVVGFSDGKEVVIPGILEILVMAKGDDRGVACQGKVMPISGFEVLVEKFKQMILTVGFVGLFDIDFYLSKGEYYFAEINMRMGGSGTAVLKMGVNLPAMFVKSQLGESIDDMRKEVGGTATYANERICSDNWGAGFITKREMRELFSSSDISFVRDEQDKKPEKMFKWELRKIFIKKTIKKCLKKK